MMLSWSLQQCKGVARPVELLTQNSTKLVAPQAGAALGLRKAARGEATWAIHATSRRRNLDVHRI